jgi:hypothetical protein
MRLAADLRAIAGAVAWEPVPPRRRDFRIDAGQAERSRGSPWSRLLRRLALPQVPALRPAAAGVMSLGLLLVVAGNVWPAEAPPAAPAPVVQSLASQAPGSAPTTEVADEALGGAARDLADAAPTEARPYAAEEREVPADVMAMEADPGEASALAEGAGGHTRDGQASSKAHDQPGAASQPDAEGDTAARPDDAVTRSLAAAPTTGAEAILEAPATEALATSIDAAALPADQPGPDVATILVAAGIVLATAGALVLLFSWLARRAADPLLR